MEEQTRVRFMLELELEDAEVETVLAAVRAALGVGEGMRAAKDPLDDCSEIIKVLGKHKKMIQEVKYPDPDGPTNPVHLIPAPVWVPYECTMYQTTRICPGHAPVVTRWEDCQAL